MQRVAKFEKMSFEQFTSDIREALGVDVDEAKALYGKIELPVRATAGSAGCDFKSPISFALGPGKSIKIPTGIRVRITDGWWLCCVPRSGLGCKYRLQLDNTMGVIDSDYYYSDNEGHIFAKITNDSKDELNWLTVNAGDRFMQGIFLPYAITYDDKVSAVRNGGEGSTGN